MNQLYYFGYRSRLKKRKRWFVSFSFAWVKMLSANQIAGFINHYISRATESISMFFLLTFIELRKVKGDLKICSWVKNILSHETAEFLKQLHLKKNEVNKPDNLCVNGDSGKFNPDLENFG